MHGTRAGLSVILLLALVGCADDTGATDTEETGDTGDGDGDGDTLPEPAGAPSLMFGDTTLYVGADENNQQEQNAIIARFDGGTLTYCVAHEIESPNSIALGLTWDGNGTAYVNVATYSAGSGYDGLGGWLSEYSPGAISGVGAQASIVGSVDVETGTLETATYVIAVTPDEEVADLLATGAPTVLADGSVELLGSAEQAPIDSDALTAMVCTAAGPHTAQYVFTDDLGGLVCVSASGCTSSSPCPE
jgi:hypothetical protein